MKYGHIVDNNEIIDEVLVTYFKKPKSYTTEDMCEINTHGGNIVTRKILELCLKNGANLAEPGEFTKRAFLNGRIDLLQAESVIDVINAKSEREAKTGIKQLEGILSKKINEIKQEILDVMVNVDVSIDYPEYDVEEVTYQEISNMLTSVKEKLEKLEKSFDNGKLIKEGIKTAIIGKPNAGKSSLLNAILKEDRAIVTEYEGTTRDTIEEFVNIEGIPLKLIDTAGIRNAKDEVEKIGIEKSIKAANNADIIIRSVAKVGIIALVDEATGYNKVKERAKDELQKFLNRFLSEEASKWVKTFNDSFFEMIYKMRGWDWKMTNKKPGVVGQWINDIVYKRLAPGVYLELQDLNPKDENGHRKEKHHQYLSNETGKPMLKGYLNTIEALGRAADYDWDVFMTLLNKAYPVQAQQYDTLLDK